MNMNGLGIRLSIVWSIHPGRLRCADNYYCVDYLLQNCEVFLFIFNRWSAVYTRSICDIQRFVVVVGYALHQSAVSSLCKYYWYPTEYTWFGRYGRRRFAIDRK